MKNLLKKIFSVQKKGKYEKKICIFGFSFKVRNYRYMMYDIFRKQNTERIRSYLKERNISLPYDGLFSGEVEITEVALKDIRREWKGKIYSLYDLSPYKFLETRDREIYKHYMQIHQPKAKDYPSEEQLDAAIAHILNLEKNIQENGYDVSKSIICLNENNVLSDGQRRACALLHLYGGDHKVKVAREYNL